MWFISSNGCRLLFQNAFQSERQAQQVTCHIENKKIWLLHIDVLHDLVFEEKH